ncbi:hypothetical protein, partial [Allomesorhizobium camelthorni]|uniref:hypothetical protein n=1 Tax=Allomesorhizobium camelthorni TaxID=475069 RepID=UPI00197FAEFB
YRLEGLTTGEMLDFDPECAEAHDPRKPTRPRAWWAEDFEDRGIPIPRTLDELRQTLFHEYIRNALPGTPWPGPKGTSWMNPRSRLSEDPVAADNFDEMEAGYLRIT